MKYPTLPKACDARGASMGRQDSVLEPDAPIRFGLYQMPMNGYGCYDSGGAYWGMGDPMWHAHGDGPKFKNELFIRAKTRDEAKAKVLARFKNATFYK